ncbi:MAG TPA: amino acid permease [Polyangiaceae bacterium]|nr:amino acid permease [Polyangiaceae bacterium]
MGSPLFAKKSVDHLIEDAGGAHHGLKRSLGALDLVMLGIGAIIGTGIFVLTGTAAAKNAGPAVALSFIVAGVASAFAGLCYAEMASMIPVAGSAYTYSYATMGELVAWIIGWDLVLEYLAGAATVSVGWSGYVVAFLEGTLGIHLPKAWTTAPVVWDDARSAFVNTGSIINLPAVLIVLAVTVVLVVGIKESARFNSAIVFVKVVIVCLFVVFAAPFVRTENWHPFIPDNTGKFGQFGVSGILQGATTVFFAYIGFDAVSTAAQETKNPQKDLPTGILGSLALCTVLYIAVSLVLTGVVPYTKLDVPHPIAVGISVTGIGWLTTAVEIGAIAGLSSVIVVMLLGQPRIFYSMAHDGLFPAFAAKVHPRFGTPHVTTIGCGLACAAAGGLLPIGFLGHLTSVGTLFAFVLVSLGVMILRLRRPDIPRAFKVPGGPYVVPILGALSSALLMATATPATLIRLFGWMAVGLVIYFTYGAKHSKLRAGTEAK